MKPEQHKLYPSMYVLYCSSLKLEQTDKLATQQTDEWELRMDYTDMYYICMQHQYCCCTHAATGTKVFNYRIQYMYTILDRKCMSSNQ